MKFWKNKQLNNLPNEIWKDITTHDGNYEISNYGRIKSLPRLREIHTGGVWYSKEKILSIDVSSNSTLSAPLSYEGVCTKLNLSKQVAIHFFDGYDEKKDVLWFKDNDNQNPMVDNLIVLNKDNYYDIINKNRSKFNNDVARFIFSLKKRRCSVCYEIKDIDKMTNSRGKVDSMYKNHDCNECHAKYMSVRREIKRKEKIKGKGKGKGDYITYKGGCKSKYLVRGSEYRLTGSPSKERIALINESGVRMNTLKKYFDI